MWYLTIEKNKFLVDPFIGSWQLRKNPPEVKQEWDVTIPKTIILDDEDVAFVMSDGKVIDYESIPYNSNPLPILTLRGWEKHREYFITLFYDYTVIAGGGFMSTPSEMIKTPEAYEQHMLLFLNRRYENIVKKITNNIKYIFSMYKTLELYGPERNWFGKTWQKAKLWLAKKLLNV